MTRETTTTVSARGAGPADAGGLADLFHEAYKHSSHPCKNPAFILEGFQKGDIWSIGETEGRVIACQALVRRTWNNSWEVGRGVTRPEFRGAGLATTLTQSCLDCAEQSPLGDLIYGFPRSSTMHFIISERTKPAMLPAGHDGGINIANDVREYHLVSLCRKASARFHHLQPRSPSLADTKFVRETIYKPLGFDPEPGRYPEDFLCGESISHPDLKPLSFGYDPFCPSDSLEVTAYTGGSEDPVRAAAEIDECLRSFAYARHVRLTVLADKTALIRALRARGFTVTAYLPAWYAQGESRFDGVLMVRSTFETDPADYGLREWIDRFRRGFSGDE